MKRKGLLIPLVLGLGLMVALLWAIGGEGLPAEAAPSALGSGAGWDGLSISAPTVILDAGTYRMWYQGRGITFYGSGWTLGYAESADGLTWNKYTGNPVLEPGESSRWDSAYRGQPAVLKDGSLYKMWYSGGGFSGPWQVGYATSTDGLDWSVYAGNPVLQAGGSGSWDEIECDGPSVIKDGSLYKMWYFGCNADYTVCSIGYATSPDGVTWTKYDQNPVLEATPGQWDEPGLAWPRVIKHGATYEMWYHSDGQVGRATSPDGIEWTKDPGPVLSEGWGGGNVALSTVLLDGTTYKMWLRSGTGSTTGIGYAESTDGIVWTQPVSNPRLQRGEAGVIIDVRYEHDQVRAQTQANTPITITVADAQGIKATISGVTVPGGYYQSWDHNEDWIPERPDILPGDTVSATAGVYSTIIETVGELDARAHNDTDLVEGTIHAPWFAPDSLSVLCEVWVEPSQFYLDRDVPADDGSFRCDFSGLVDITGGQGGMVGYLEPDGDMVSVEFQTPYMEVYYGILDADHHTAASVGGIYAIGHTFSVTVTNSAGDIKATATVTSTYDGGWWGDGFRPWWSGGECCDWSPAEPDIRPGDWVHFRSDDGYENQVQVGAIYGTVDVENDSVTGPVYARWLTQTLEVWCHPQTLWPPVYRQSSAQPDGSLPYFCEWQNPTGDQEPWDIQLEDQVMVRYREPDGDQVYRMMIASEGAPPPIIYLPLVVRRFAPAP